MVRESNMSWFEIPLSSGRLFFTHDEKLILPVTAAATRKEGVCSLYNTYGILSGDSPTP
jgi:hypothetical protein